MNHAENAFVDGSLRERQKNYFVYRSRRPLCGGIEFTNRLYFIAEELNAQRTIRFRRIHIENAATQREFTRHIDCVGRVRANRAKVFEQRIDINRLAAPHDASKI